MDILISRTDVVHEKKCHIYLASHRKGRCTVHTCTDENAMLTMARDRTITVTKRVQMILSSLHYTFTAAARIELGLKDEMLRKQKSSNFKKS